MIGLVARRGLTLRQYHTTKRVEILPLVGVAVLSFVGRYGFKALQRMEHDKLEYEEYLAGLPTDGSVPSNPHNVPSQKVLGIDFGTSSLRCAILNDRKATIVEDKDGGRSTPSYVFFENASESPLVPICGRLAKSKLFAGPQEVKSVYSMLADAANDGDGKVKEMGTAGAGHMIREVAGDAIEKRGIGTIGDCECVLTFSPQFNEYQQEMLVNAAKSAGLIDPLIVCEAVGALIGAEFEGVIGKEVKAKPCVVVDVGHSVTHVSVVEDDALLCSESVAMGGETLENVLVDLLAGKFAKSNNGMDLLSDKLSLQRVHDAAFESVAELSNKSMCDVDLPFITADAEGPKHLQESISSGVLESAVNDSIKAIEGAEGDSIEKVFTNLLMKNLEQSGKTPFDLGAVLLVGGASRQPIFEKSLKSAVGLMGGEDWASQALVAIEGEKRAELTAIGASVAIKE
ncbi:hypothetical protein TrRE_jg7970 [Triparma retinervis]|uniref:Uncharacterized protein n=1 Tax=Triparma retinervis TaxID=2557542 RepID=A0A9W7FFW9_9STRA|nr:hypothetical protein TrRE_jg7970 [Triparma retinervis]